MLFQTIGEQAESLFPLFIYLEDACLIKSIA